MAPFLHVPMASLYQENATALLVGLPNQLQLRPEPRETQGFWGGVGWRRVAL